MKKTILKFIEKTYLINFLRPFKKVFDFLEFFVIKTYLEKSYKNVELSVIQVGANDGSKSDHVNYILTSTNFPGILLEPNPVPFKLLEKNYIEYKNVKILNAAISFKDGHEYLHIISFSDKRWATGLATFNRRTLGELIDSGYVRRKAIENGDSIPASVNEYITEKRVECITVKSLFEKFYVDDFLLAIDVEGFDLEVFKMFLSERRLPKILIIEYVHLSTMDLLELKTILSKENYGYRIFSRDIIAKLKDV
jgi:FkbM family methyltransferase